MIRASLSDGSSERDRDRGRHRMLLKIGDQQYHLSNQEVQKLMAEIAEYLQTILALENKKKGLK